MEIQYNTNLDRLAALRTDDQAAHKAIFEALQAAQSLPPVDWQGGEPDVIQAIAFRVMTKYIVKQKPEDDKKIEVQALFDQITQNWIVADIIRRNEQPKASRLLTELKKDDTVINTVKGKIKNNPELDAKSIVQEAFSRLFESIFEMRYGGRSNLRSFYISICENIIKEHFNKGKVKIQNPNEGEAETMKKEVAFDEYETAGRDSVIASRHQFDPLEATERADLVAKAIGQLRDICKKVLPMRYFEDMSNAQIGEILGRQTQTINNDANACREELAVKLRRMPEMADYLEKFLKK